MKAIKIFFILLKVILVPFRVLYAMLVDDRQTKSTQPVKKDVSSTASKINDSQPNNYKPESFIKGEDFENFLRGKIFTKDHYTLVHKTHSYETNSED